MFGFALSRVESDVATQVIIALLRKSLQFWFKTWRHRTASCKVCRDLGRELWLRHFPEDHERDNETGSAAGLDEPEIRGPVSQSTRMQVLRQGSHLAAQSHMQHPSWAPAPTLTDSALAQLIA